MILDSLNLKQNSHGIKNRLAETLNFAKIGYFLLHFSRKKSLWRNQNSFFSSSTLTDRTVKIRCMNSIQSSLHAVVSYFQIQLCNSSKYNSRYCPISLQTSKILSPCKYKNKRKYAFLKLWGKKNEHNDSNSQNKCKTKAQYLPTTERRFLLLGFDE